MCVRTCVESWMRLVRLWESLGLRSVTGSTSPLHIQTKANNLDSTSTTNHVCN
uniref:Uncharacterized protein n=1 Tax=Helianthus annuus TaxID=4232 RepID=A0A251TQK7_HELAN